MDIEEETLEASIPFIEVIKNPPSSIKTVKFIKSYFSCFQCTEVGEAPFFLKCDHVYCERCLANIKEKNGSISCPFCFSITKPEDILPQSDVKVLLQDLKSINDDDFKNKYGGKIALFNSLTKNSNESDKVSSQRNIIKYLISFVSLEFKEKMKSKTKNKDEKYSKKRAFNDIVNPEDSYTCINNVFNKKKKPKFI